MSYLNWHVGMKVALKDGAPVGLRSGWNYPVLGRVYTIRELFMSDGEVDVVCLLLNEVRNRKGRFIGGVCEPGFRASWFRQVEPRQTDSSIFTQMLNSSKINVGEAA